MGNLPKDKASIVSKEHICEALILLLRDASSLVRASAAEALSLLYDYWLTCVCVCVKIIITFIFYFELCCARRFIIVGVVIEEGVVIPHSCYNVER